MLDLALITTLYHGSNQKVREPNPFFNRTNRDFGQGFYTTASKEDAYDWANKVARRSATGNPVVNTYDYINNECLSVFVFGRTETELIDWIDFILFNRGEKNLIGYSFTNRITHDIIVGPIADNRIAPIFEVFSVSQARFIEERHQATDPNKFKKRLIEDLDIDRLKDQVCFKNLASIKCLSYREHQ
jgi:hypothetical protein